MRQEYFYCYTRGLKDYLKSFGFEYITTAKAISTNRQFWLFERSEKLMEKYYEHKSSVQNEEKFSLIWYLVNLDKNFAQIDKEGV